MHPFRRKRTSFFSVVALVLCVANVAAEFELTSSGASPLRPIPACRATRCKPLFRSLMQLWRATAGSCIRPRPQPARRRRGWLVRAARIAVCILPSHGHAALHGPLWQAFGHGYSCAVHAPHVCGSGERLRGVGQESSPTATSAAKTARWARSRSRRRSHARWPRRRRRCPIFPIR